MPSLVEYMLLFHMNTDNEPLMDSNLFIGLLNGLITPLIMDWVIN